MQLSADNFFRELINGRLTAADRIFQTMKQEVGSEEWYRGYLNALEGMLSANSSKNDEYTFINQNDVKKADKFARIFSHLSGDRMQGDFDRGFFAAWADYMKSLKG